MTYWEVNTEVGGTDVRLRFGAITSTIPPEEAEKIAVALTQAATYARRNKETQ